MGKGSCCCLTGGVLNLQAPQLVLAMQIAAPGTHTLSLCTSRSSLRGGTMHQMNLRASMPEASPHSSASTHHLPPILTWVTQGNGTFMEMCLTCTCCCLHHAKPYVGHELFPVLSIQYSLFFSLFTYYSLQYFVSVLSILLLHLRRAEYVHRCVNLKIII